MRVISTKNLSNGTYDIIDPHTLDTFPVITLCSEVQSPIGSAISVFSHGNYNHIMLQISATSFVSQDMRGLRKRPVSDFMKPRFKLKFFGIYNRDYRRALMEDTLKRLDAPWWKRRYDFLGIVGHLLHIPCIQSPLAHYCSELAAKQLNAACKLNPPIPKYASPAQMNTLFKNYDFIKLLGYWFVD